jgi:hypothetical protein
MKEIINEPEALINKICDFIGVNEKLISLESKNKKVNSAIAPRNRILSKYGSWLVTKLHEYRLHFIVNTAKKIGFKKIFFKKANEKPELTEDEQLYLRNELKFHKDYINSKFGKIL